MRAALTLPSPSDSQPFFAVSGIEAGSLTLPGERYIDPCRPSGLKWVVPTLAYLLRHSGSGEYFLLDMGIRKDHEKLPPAAVKFMEEYKPLMAERDVAEKLKDGGVDPSNVKHVCLSHMHWDHIGDPTLFPASTFIVGGPARRLIEGGYPHNPKSMFPSDLLPDGRTVFLEDADPRWAPIGPFERAVDWFGDGSLYIVDAPGHLPGHINVLARTSSDGGWVYLAGDSAHDWRLVHGTARIAEVRGTSGEVTFCGHRDKTASEKHIGRIRGLMQLSRVRVMLAHDVPWWEENRDKEGSGIWPGTIPSL
ncbi:Metallo-hydrolase/oxidoreductase [Amylostereum chailletii]|nr:Metallo-hydrolase/oxidoreductase [Amylostereum chailletii]